MGVLRADADVQVVAGVGLGEESHENHLFFEGVENGGDVAKVDGSSGEVGRTGDDDLRVASTAE